MRLEIGHARILIQGIRLQVQTRGIDVGRADVRAPRSGSAADDGENHALVVVVAVDAVAGLQLHAGLQFRKPAFSAASIVHLTASRSILQSLMNFMYSLQ